MVLASPPYFDGLGPTSLAVWDVTGKTLFERMSNAKHQATIGDAQWEDDSHLVASVYQEGAWSLVRIATDGTMETVVSPMPSEDYENPFVLSLGGPATGS